MRFMITKKQAEAWVKRLQTDDEEIQRSADSAFVPIGCPKPTIDQMREILIRNVWLMAIFPALDDADKCRWLVGELSDEEANKKLTAYLKEYNFKRAMRMRNKCFSKTINKEIKLIGGREYIPAWAHYGEPGNKTRKAGKIGSFLARLKNFTSGIRWTGRFNRVK